MPDPVTFEPGPTAAEVWPQSLGLTSQQGSGGGLRVRVGGSCSPDKELTSKVQCGDGWFWGCHSVYGRRATATPSETGACTAANRPRSAGFSRPDSSPELHRTLPLPFATMSRCTVCASPFCCTPHSRAAPQCVGQLGHANLKCILAFPQSGVGPGPGFGTLQWLCRQITHLAPSVHLAGAASRQQCRVSVPKRCCC